MTLGRIGVWSGAFAVAPAKEARSAVREIDELGYDTLWYPEGLGTRESLTNGAVLLGASERIRVASGIASSYTHCGSGQRRRSTDDQRYAGTNISITVSASKSIEALAPCG